MGKYDDIINLERPVSRKHTPMSRDARAAQFAPFEALSGYSDAISETSKRSREDNFDGEDKWTGDGEGFFKTLS